MIREGGEYWNHFDWMNPVQRAEMMTATQNCARKWREAEGFGTANPRLAFLELALDEIDRLSM